MPINNTNVRLAKIMRQYGNVPQNISATPLAAAEQKAVPYLAQEANRNAAVAARSFRTAKGAEQGRRKLALREQELQAYEDQADKATLFALADLFGVTPLSIYSGIKADQKRQAEQEAWNRQRQEYLNKMNQNAQANVAAIRNQTVAYNEMTNRLDPTHREWWDSVAGFSY